MHNLFPTTVKVYEEMAFETEAAKESDRLAKATLARLETMKTQALMTLGYYNPKFCKTETEKVGNYDSLFAVGPRGASDNAPKLKLSDVMAEKAIARDDLQIRRSKETSE